MAHKIKVTGNKAHLWQFDCVYDYENKEFVIYANGKKSFTTFNTDEAPEAMLEYFEKWDTDEVSI